MAVKDVAKQVQRPKTLSGAKILRGRNSWIRPDGGVLVFPLCEGASGTGRGLPGSLPIPPSRGLLVWMNGKHLQRRHKADLEAMARWESEASSLWKWPGRKTMAPDGRCCLRQSAVAGDVQTRRSGSQASGLQVDMNNDAGWCGSGALGLRQNRRCRNWSQLATAINGPQRFEGSCCSQPKALRELLSRYKGPGHSRAG